MTDDEPPKPDLSLVGTDDLIDELQRRHDATLIVREADALNGASETEIHYSGGVSRCLGLSARATQRLLSLVRRTDTEEDNDNG